MMGFLLNLKSPRVDKARNGGFYMAQKIQPRGHPGTAGHPRLGAPPNPATPMPVHTFAYVQVGEFPRSLTLDLKMNATEHQI